MSKYNYNEDILDELHKDLYEPTKTYYDINNLYLSGKELEIAKEAEELEMAVLRYLELTDDDKYNEKIKVEIELICNYCIDKIIEMHRGKPIVVDEDGLFVNAGYANYYSDIITIAYHADPIAIGDYINSYYETKKKTK